VTTIWSQPFGADRFGAKLFWR